MNPTVSRRTLAKGAAWSTPVVLAAGPVHAATASSACLSEAEINAGLCTQKAASAWNVGGARNYLTGFGGLVDAVSTFNFSVWSDCYGRRPVSWRMHNESVHRDLPKASLTLSDGTVYQGTATGGSDIAGGAKLGVGFSATIRWQNSKWSRKKDWNRARVSIPILLHYTAPNGTAHNCQLVFKCTMTSGYSSVLHGMEDPHFEV